MLHVCAIESRYLCGVMQGVHACHVIIMHHACIHSPCLLAVMEGTDECVASHDILADWLDDEVLFVADGGERPFDIDDGDDHDG